MFPAPHPDALFNAPRLLFLANIFSGVAQLVTPDNATARLIFNEYNLKGATPLQTTENIYGLITSFEYLPEREGDHWQYPEETLKLRSGDCEDLSSLLSTFFELGGLTKNYFVLLFNVNWREYHLANLVYVPHSQSHGDGWLYLDGSYPHPLGDLPFYGKDAQVFGFFSVKNPSTNPILATMPQPLSIFLENAALNQLLLLQ